DKKLPLREHAPSRFKVLNTPNGPFSESHLRTVPGLASACIARGILWNAKFLHSDDSNCYFEDYESFKEEIDAAREAGYEDEDIVNSNAYGAWTDRNLETSKRYFESAADKNLTGWLTANNPAKFSDVVDIFEKGIGSDKELAFPGLGSLQAFCLAGDYTMAGVIAMPTAEETGARIHHIGKGGLKGLHALGLVASKKKKDTTKAECVLAFKKVYNYLDKTLSDADKERMKFSVLLVEHALCKYQRL
ncbi:hypothetical protein C8J57DRAFT_954951, partial [Mycena rebaudengoi]